VVAANAPQCPLTRTQLSRDPKNDDDRADPPDDVVHEVLLVRARRCSRPDRADRRTKGSDSAIETGSVAVRSRTRQPEAREQLASYQDLPNEPVTRSR